MQSVHIPVSFKSHFMALFDRSCFSTFRGCKVDLPCFVAVLLVCRREMMTRAPVDWQERRQQNAYRDTKCYKVIYCLLRSSQYGTELGHCTNSS